MAIFHGGIFRFESPVIYRMETIVNNFANDVRNFFIFGKKVLLYFRRGT